MARLTSRTAVGPKKAEPDRIAGERPSEEVTSGSYRENGEGGKAEPNAVLSYVGKRIFDYRAKRGIKQTDLASRAEMHVGTVFLIEAGRQNLKLTTLVAIAKALGCHVTDLLPPGQTSLLSIDRLRETAAEMRGQLDRQDESIKRQAEAAKQQKELLARLELMLDDVTEVAEALGGLKPPSDS